MMRLVWTAALCSTVLMNTGCSTSEESRDGDARRNVEQLVAAKSPEQPVKSVSCVELSAVRHYRCEVAEGADGSEGSVYEAIVSKDGEAVQLIAR
jgi:hypothetical protein